MGKCWMVSSETAVGHPKPKFQSELNIGLTNPFPILSHCYKPNKEQDNFSEQFQDSETQPLLFVSNRRERLRPGSIDEPTGEMGLFRHCAHLPVASIAANRSQAIRPWIDQRLTGEMGLFRHCAHLPAASISLHVQEMIYILNKL
jgi:hypothetical protein